MVSIVGWTPERNSPVQHTHENECDHPRVLLVRVDELEPEDGDDIRHHGDDDNADLDRQTVVRDGAQDLAYDHQVDDVEASADDNIEDGAQLGSPESEANGRSLMGPVANRRRKTYEYREHAI